MTGPGAPRRGRHSLADDSTGGLPASWRPPATREGSLPAGRDALPTREGLAQVIRARHAAGEGRDAPQDGGAQDGRDTEGFAGPIEWPADGYVPEPGRHPSAPLPPRPPGVWDRFAPRADDGGTSSDEAPTEAHPMPADARPAPPARHEADPPYAEAHDDANDAQPLDWPDQTGGLEVIGAHVDDRRGRRRRRVAEHDAHAEEHDADDHGPEEDLVLPPRGRDGRRSRRPLGVLVILLLLVGVVAGVLVGGKMLLDLVNPASEDFAGAGTGTAEVRVEEGDTLSDIGRTLVDAGVIASVEPFVDAAEANAASTGLQPGVYALRQEMSGQAALDLMLDPASRQISRVTVPEGLTLQDTLQLLADATGLPIQEFRAAAAKPAALGVPAYAGGQLEGYLFPATYDVEPDTEPAEMLRTMVAEFNQVAADLRLEQRAAAAGRSPADIVTVASMIQSETRLDEERPDVAQVIYNRLEQEMPLGIDATLAYGLDKSGNELTVDDLRTDSPYNTRTRTGLPPTPVSAPGEASLEAALSPSTGSLLYYVLESQDGSHFFTDDYAEFQEARARCAAAGLGCGG